MNFSVQPREAGSVEIARRTIAFASWGADGLPAVILVHGGGAHMGWWDAVIRVLAETHHVTALDLSGHGDSAWAADYTGDQWASEVIAVAEQVTRGPIVLVGHSLGGRVSIIAAAEYPDAVRELVLVDTPLRRPDDTVRQRFAPVPRAYARFEDALGSFHLRPNEPVLDRELFIRIAGASFKETGGRWTLKADPQVFGRVSDAQLASCLARISTPITLVYGDRSAVVDEDSRTFLSEAHAGSTSLLRVNGGFHHLPLDRADEVARAIVGVSAEPD